MRFFKFKSCSLLTFSWIVSIGTLLLYNLPFFSYVAEQTNEDMGGKVLLLVSLAVVMLSLNFMMTYLVMFLARRVGRVLLALLALINATAVYFIVTYSVMIDATTIENVFNTRYSEASGFFSWGLWLFIACFGVLPALFCLLQPVVYGKAKKMGLWCGGSLAVVLVVALLNIGQTLFVTEHDTELGGLLQPWSYVANTCRVISFSHDEQQEEIKLPDGKITDEEKAVVVLVIGESARKANFQLYGYQRNTNPMLKKRKDLKVYEATSCATYTTAGTKAILEPVNSDDLYELLPNYAFRTGVDVSWRTSNWGEPPIHIDEYLRTAGREIPRREHLLRCHPDEGIARTYYVEQEEQGADSAAHEYQSRPEVCRQISEGVRGVQTCGKKRGGGREERGYAGERLRQYHPLYRLPAGQPDQYAAGDDGVEECHDVRLRPRRVVGREQGVHARTAHETGTQGAV